MPPVAVPAPPADGKLWTSLLAPKLDLGLDAAPVPTVLPVLMEPAAGVVANPVGIDLCCASAGAANSRLKIVKRRHACLCSSDCFVPTTSSELFPFSRRDADDGGISGRWIGAQPQLFPVCYDRRHVQPLQHPRSQDAMRRLFAAAHDLTGNLPPLMGVFPDMPAPIVRVAEGESHLEDLRWGTPGPPQFGGAPVTNIRNTSSPHWRRWLGPESRCLVPVNSFCEWADTKPKKTPTWFALDDSRL